MGAYVTLTGKARNVKELQYLQSGTPVLGFSCAVVAKRGETPDDTQFDWYNVSIFGNTAESLAGKIVDGTRFLVMGRQSIKRYEKPDGTTSVSINVISMNFEFVGEKQEEGAQARPAPKKNAKPQSKEEDSDPGF